MQTGGMGGMPRGGAAQANQQPQTTTSTLLQIAPLLLFLFISVITQLPSLFFGGSSTPMPEFSFDQTNRFPVRLAFLLESERPAVLTSISSTVATRDTFSPRPVLRQPDSVRFAPSLCFVPPREPFPRVPIAEPVRLETVQARPRRLFATARARVAEEQGRERQAAARRVDDRVRQVRKERRDELDQSATELLSARGEHFPRSAPPLNPPSS